MAGIPSTKLKNIHQGDDMWVIASGPSAGFISPDFFENKWTIGVNRVWNRFLTDYIVIKESEIIDQAIASGMTVIASLYNCGDRKSRKTESEGKFYYFDHLHNAVTDVRFSDDEDDIVVSYSTITSAMHMAAYMGARNIIVVGHDCGSLDGRLNFEGYPSPLIKTDGFYERFLSKIEEQSVQVRAWLEKKYGCRIYSLNPFLNFGLEGHTYESAHN